MSRGTIKPNNKGLTKLEARRKAWDALSEYAKRGTKRPGSTNRHKAC